MKIILSILVTLILLVSCRSTSSDESKKMVYIDNFKLFDSFAMKKDYDKLIENEVNEERLELNRLATSLNSEKDGLKQVQLKKVFFEKKQLFDQKFQELSNKYTEKVYERLNQYISEYGKQNHYSIILGTTGQGNVMYVDSTVNITKQLIDFANSKYND